MSRWLPKHTKKTFFNYFSWIIVVAMLFSLFSYLLVPRAAATTGGQMLLYLKKEPSDINSTYNDLNLSNSDTQADIASSTTSTTTVNVAGAPTAFCESSNNTGETFTQISASAASAAELCIGTFISAPVGQSITISNTDSSAVWANIYTSESSSAQVTSHPNIYIYQCSSTCTAPGTLIKAFTGCADPGTTPTVCAAAQTHSAPTNNVTISAGQRIVAIISQTITKGHSGQFVSNYIDNSTRSPSSSVGLAYTFATANKPALTGSQDDDFNVASADANCSSTIYNTNWTCPGPTASGATADIDSADASGSGGNNAGWLIVRNKCTSCTVSNFGTTPSNAFIYQTIPTGYGDGSVRTVVDSALSYTIGASTPSSPWNHVGLVLWTSNTDYLEVQLYSTGVKSSTNTVQVAVNNSGTLGSATNINTSTTLGTYGLIWLGFSKTGANYQAQYSTDGSTWNNISTTIAHSTAFSRVGLNAFADISGANYSGAFDWFSYSFVPPPTTDQVLRGGEFFYGGSKQPFYWAQ